MTGKKLICLCLCACSLLCGALSACGNKNEATPDEAGTTSVTTVTEATGNSTESDTAKDEKSTTSAEGGEWEGTNKNKNKNNSTNKRPDNIDVDNANGSPGLGVAKRCTITVGNKGYVKDVGDTFTYTYYLKTPKMIENVQAQLTYDSAMLKIKSSNTKEMFPTIGAGVVYNTKESNIVYFNASSIDGYDFTKKSALITIEFEVINTGGTAVATAIEYMDEIGAMTSYVNAFKMSDKVEYEETLK